MAQNTPLPDVSQDATNRLREARRHNRELKKQRRAVALERENDVLESIGIQGLPDFAGSFYAMLDRFNQNQFNFYGASTINDRRYGRNGPFIYLNEQDLQVARLPSRFLTSTNCYAIGMLEGWTSFICGEGFVATVQAKSGKENQVPKPILQKLQGVIDDFADRNQWDGGEQPGLEEELVQRPEIDGGFLLCLHEDDAGMTWADTVEMEQLTMPPGADMDYLFGIYTPKGTQRPEKYWLRGWNTDLHGEEYDAEQIVHFKTNVMRQMKVGFPSFSFSMLDTLNLSDDLRKALGLGGKFQASIAGVEQYETAAKEQVQSFANSFATFQKNNPMSGQAENIEVATPGQIHRVAKGQQWVDPPNSRNAPAHIQILQACLRAASVRYNAPDWLGSGDASANTYDNSVATGSTFGRRILREQQRFKHTFHRIFWWALNTRCERAGQITATGNDGKVISMTWEELKKLVDVEITPAAVQERDKKQEADRIALLVEKKLMSPQQAIKELGEDVEETITQIKDWETRMGPPPGQPGAEGDDPNAPPPPDGDDDGGGPPLADVADNLRESKDASGHEHAADGKFASTGGGGSAAKKDDKPAAKPKHGERATKAHASYHELLAKAKAARIDAFNEVKADAEKALAQADEHNDVFSDEMDNLHWEADEDAADFDADFAELESAISEYDPDGDVPSRFSALRDVEAAAKQALAAEQVTAHEDNDKRIAWNKEIGDAVNKLHTVSDEADAAYQYAIGALKEASIQKKPEHFQNRFDQLNAKLKELGNPCRLVMDGANPVIDKSGLDKLIDETNEKLGDNPHSIKMKHGQLSLEMDDDQMPAGFTDEQKAENKTRLKAIIKSARAARQALKLYTKHRKEMRAIKSGEVMDVQESLDYDVMDLDDPQLVTLLEDWDESKHKRDHGKFSSTGGSSGEKSKKKTTRARKTEKRTPNTLYKIIRSRGGIDVESLRSTYDVKQEFVEAGLMGVLAGKNKDRRTRGLDQWAKTLEEEGHILIPDGVNPEQHLLDLLQQKARSLHDDLADEIEAQEQEYYRLMKEAQDAGIDQGEIDAAIRSGEEAGVHEAQKGDAWEGPDELADPEEENAVDAWWNSFRESLSTDPLVEIITDRARIQSLLNVLTPAKTIGLDLEWTEDQRVRLMSISIGPAVYVIDCFKVDPSPLFGILAAKKIVIHNAPSDLRLLEPMGFTPGVVIDTMALQRANHPGEPYSLADCVRQHLGRERDKTLQTSDWSGELTPEQYAYSADDAADLIPLARCLGGCDVRESADWDESKHKRAADGKFGSGGGTATKERPAKAAHQQNQRQQQKREPAKAEDAAPKTSIIDKLKKAGAMAAHVEHVAKEYAKDKIGAAVEKLPGWAQTSVHNLYAAACAGTKVAFLGWSAMQTLAERVAVERGSTPEEARRLKGVLQAVDIAAFKPVAILTAGSGILTGASWVIPPATGLYLAYSTARNPIKTAKAAVGLVHDAIVQGAVGGAIVGVSALQKIGIMEGQEDDGAKGAHKIADALEAHDHNDAYIAVLHACMDGCPDLSTALELADRLYKENDATLNALDTDENA